MTNKLNQVFLILTDKDSKTVIDFYKKIKTNTERIGDVYILYHQKGHVVPKEIAKCSHYTFTYNQLDQLGYNPIENNLIPGSNHFPLLKFFLEYPFYEYYWFIEEDVRFSGDWCYFFNFFDELRYDFVSSNICSFHEEPGWYWWFSLQHPYKSIPIADRLRSFNPIYRISNQALISINHVLKDNWSGHHEVLLPTLLHSNGCKLLDFGGNGEFTIANCRNKFYKKKNSDKYGRLIEGTFRFRPSWRRIGRTKNSLYHPVKYKSTRKINFATQEKIK